MRQPEEEEENGGDGAGVMVGLAVDSDDDADDDNGSGGSGGGYEANVQAVKVIPALLPVAVVSNPPAGGAVKQEQKSEALNGRYTCPYCSKMFVHRWMMERHMISHTGAKPYSCSRCGNVFSLQSSVVRHLRTVHKDEVGTTDLSSLVVKVSN